MKGISEVIATILMLMITLALAGTAYMYIFGVFTARTGKVVVLLSADCITNTKHILMIRNDGTQNIGTEEISIRIDEVIADCDPGAGTGVVCSSGNLNAGRSCIVECFTNSGSGVHRIRVVGPANVASGTSFCT